MLTRSGQFVSAHDCLKCLMLGERYRYRDGIAVVFGAVESNWVCVEVHIWTKQLGKRSARDSQGTSKPVNRCVRGLRIDRLGERGGAPCFIDPSLKLNVFDKHEYFCSPAPLLP